MPNATPRVILMAEDDPEDRFLVSRAMQKISSVHQLHMAEDGDDLLDYLRGKDHYADRAKYPLPSLILLDLNMPRMDGRTVLEVLRQEPELQSIPVVVLTTSESEEDVDQCYQLGANSYLCKPAEFPELMSQLQALTHYWFDTVELPRGDVA